MPVIDSPTVAEIATKSLAAVRVFEKLGIDYCCGGKRPLAEVCRTKGLDAEAVQRLLDEAAKAPNSSARDWTAEPLRELISHILNTHHTYLKRELPAIGIRLAKVYRVYNQRYGPTLTGLPEVFEQLRAELEAHMAKEEMVLFPAVATGANVANPIAMMEAEHESAGEALVRIREITQDFYVPECACVTYRALMGGLKELKEDLHMHVHLENNVLFPRVLSDLQ